MHPRAMERPRCTGRSTGDDADTVGLLIDSGANVNAATDLGITPLALAAANGNADVAGTLLEAGADPDAGSEAGVTPLMQAARTGRIETVRALLEFGADVNANERTRGQTALMWAVSQQHADVVEVLLRYGADVHARTSTRRRIVMLDRGTREGVQTSEAIGDPLDVGGSRPLLFAARVGDLDSARLLLAAGADANSTSADSHSALVVAAFGGHERVVRLLLEAGGGTQRRRRRIHLLACRRTERKPSGGEHAPGPRCGSESADDERLSGPSAR